MGQTGQDLLVYCNHWLMEENYFLKKRSFHCFFQISFYTWAMPGHAHCHADQCCYSLGRHRYIYLAEIFLCRLQI